MAYSVRGWMGRRIEAAMRNWMLQMPKANPALLQMFRDRDGSGSPASEHLLKWSGEFAGKYLIAGAQFMVLTRDAELTSALQAFVADLIACQDRDGYLGAFERRARMLGKPESKVWSNFFPAADRLGEWNGWFTLGDNVFPAGSAVTALSTRPGGTSLYVLGLDGKVWTNFFPAADGAWQWNGWFALGDNEFPAGTTVAALSTEPGGTSLYVRGAGDAIWTNYFPAPTPPNAWSGWWPLIFPPYASWLPAPSGLQPVPFSQNNPLRAQWPV
jgi:hypothetical protein